MPRRPPSPLCDEPGCSFLQLLNPPHSKSSIFALAGTLSFDVLRLHPERRLVSNCLRSLVGAKFAKLSWKQSLHFNNNDEKDHRDKLLFDALLAWAAELCAEESWNCDHFVPPHPTDERRQMRLRVQSDASLFGGGHVIDFWAEEAWHSIQMDGYVWKRCQYNYHANRQEALAFHRSIRSLSLFIEHFVSNTPHRWTFDVLAETDSKSVVAWTTAAGEIQWKGSKPFEARQISRIISGIKEEIEAIRRHGTVRVQHLEGVSNSTADRLSRLAYRPVHGAGGRGASTIGSLMRLRSGGSIEENGEDCNDDHGRGNERRDIWRVLRRPSVPSNRISIDTCRQYRRDNLRC